ncbi:hypothetical protein C4585_02850 [Candidatus Parcubacteria bacterium]|nr:MAG: hypothetical protein C4585_02850 [Candidatus Parcubacteria bacterium]
MSMKKTTAPFIFSAILLLAIVSVPAILFAQCTNGFCPLADVEGSDLETLYGTGDGNLVQFLNRLFGLALAVGGILAVFRIAWGGYLYMTTDLWSSKERAKETLRDTVLGLLLLIAVYTILNQINPGLLNLNVLETLEKNPAPKIESPTSGPTGGP